MGVGALEMTFPNLGKTTVPQWTTIFSAGSKHWQLLFFEQFEEGALSDQFLGIIC